MRKRNAVIAIDVRLDEHHAYVKSTSNHPTLS